MSSLARAALAGMMAALFVLTCSIDVRAAGLGMGPAEIEIEEAVRGEEYEQTVFVKYTGTEDCTIELTAIGDIADWLTICTLNEPDEPIESTTAPAGEWTYLVVKCVVPQDAPAGTSTGTVKAVTKPTSQGETVNLQATVSLSVNVVDTDGPPIALIVGIAAAAIVPAAVVGIVVYRRRASPAP